MPFVNNRWLGGTLTNFTTISKRIQYYNNLRQDFEATLEEAETAGLSRRQTKRERVLMQKEYERLTRAFAGLRTLERPPGAIFIVDPSMEEIAVHEANRSRIPILAMCDTNADPDVIDFPIPSNDDAIRAIQLMTGLVADAVLEGVAVGEVEQQFQDATQGAAAESMGEAPSEAAAE
jgi:small subunit ribosomal protein S2